MAGGRTGPARGRFEHATARADSPGFQDEANEMAETKLNIEEILADADADSHGAIYDISVDVTAVLGTSSMPISQILKLGRGAVVELDRLVGEEIELHAEENLIAKGEVVVIEDRLGVSITKIIKRS